MKLVNKPPSKESLDMLKALKQAVGDALERKKKLGQYYVVSHENKITYIGDDAPTSN